MSLLKVTGKFMLFTENWSHCMNNKLVSTAWFDHFLKLSFKDQLT